MELDRLLSKVMPLPAVTLTFDPLSCKPSQDISRPMYMCDLILVKLAPVVTNILHSHSFLSHHLL